MRSLAALASAVLLVMLAFAAPAGARDDRVPRVELRIGQRSPILHSFTSSWTYRRGAHCVGEESDGVPGFRPALEIASRRARPRLVLHKRARPEEVRITGYRRLGESLPAGSGRNYRARLGPRRRAGEIVAWVARPRISVKHRLFLTLFAAWSDRSGCLPDGPEDSAYWSFGLRRDAG
jgi:hypothetical protein